MNVDLHCHSRCSDGSLSPKTLLQKARENHIEIFSITDHDSIDAYSELSINDQNIKLVSGIEFSTTWNKIGIHIVGLNFDLFSENILKTIQNQKESRTLRAKIISQKLEKVGLDDSYKELMNANLPQIGRPDFAKLLVTKNICKDVNQAFKKYLGAGKIGDIKSQWTDMKTIIQSIRHAGGFPVLAHPLKYKLTSSKLKRLIRDFKNDGGQALEVVSGYQTKDQCQFMIKCCNDFNLMASMGSDFHAETRFSRLGCDSKLIQDCDLIWDYF